MVVTKTISRTSFVPEPRHVAKCLGRRPPKSQIARCLCTRRETAKHAFRLLRRADRAHTFASLRDARLSSPTRSPCFSMVDGGRPRALLVLLAAAGIARRATLAARRHKHPQQHRRRGSCFCRRAIETQCGCAARRNRRPAAPPAARDICSREHRAARARCSS